MSNRLQYETSPYLLQHKDNPVDWYPWCHKAFERAASEDKPIFLSIGYSTCHWCHVMAHESFEDPKTARLLNRHFICIKVDREERPDIDSVYMAVCQAYTGNGGWPTSIFMTAEQKPFFAGTYFPKTTRGGMIGLYELASVIIDKWHNDRKTLLSQSDKIIATLRDFDKATDFADIQLAHTAVKIYERIYDTECGGFGQAPKFPTPHNILFLLSYYERYKKQSCLQMAEHTLAQMYRGGMFDHIGYGFCRYSTDDRFLVPHFEKMLYDNALMILAYCKAYSITKKPLYLEIAQKTADYVLLEMTSSDGGFYSAQDADSEGEEGKYYLFTPDEIISVLGPSDAQAFCCRFDISDGGNFEGKSIPNLLKSDKYDNSPDKLLPAVYDYRKRRYSLHLDDKILTSWNSLMIAALCELYLVCKNGKYLDAAKKADEFIQNHLYNDGKLYVSCRDKKRGTAGFLDDYAAYAFAQLALCKATLDPKYTGRAKTICDKVTSDFCDGTDGYYLYSGDSEELILRPKETYDGAIPSGNSLMAYNLVRLSLITDSDKYRAAAERQLDFLASFASQYPVGYAMFLNALLEYYEPPMKVTVVCKGNDPLPDFPSDAVVNILNSPTEQYPQKNGKTTYYVCRNHTCMPPANKMPKGFDKL